ncbi:MAG: glycerol-3-phosphate 1-O-acyltransferase PlsY [Chloroflexi bacterium]|nr:glycerol-3-phosphate 1-O-acyltransferase PlsY [Chloroflexota bacterium]MCL5110230.1 glycerol-3-phosphate 1-O-acyltransferase PlsY [Chloroflexota bacterium]
MTILLDAALLLVSYLLGSVPPAFLVGKWLAGIDIRRHGSGNVGATNVLRTLGPGPSALVFALDFLKGFLPAWAAWQLSGSLLVGSLCGLATVVGHNWSVFLRFTGGKGVTSSVGVLFALLPVVGAVALGTGLAVIAVTRFVSLGSLAGAVVTAIGAILVWQLGGPAEPLAYCLIAPLLAFYRHRANIARLRSGTESRIGQRVSVGRQ